MRKPKDGEIWKHQDGAISVMVSDELGPYSFVWQKSLDYIEKAQVICPKSDLWSHLDQYDEFGRHCDYEESLLIELIGSIHGGEDDWGDE